MRLTIEDLNRKIERLNRKICCIEQSSNGGSLSQFFIQDSNSISLFGDGTELNPLIAQSLIPPIQNGIVRGGEVTWISGYTYSVNAAVYYINGVEYSSPTTTLTLDPSDTVDNRIDVFALTASESAIVITGTPSPNPEQPSINTGTQIITSFALVTANTTSPVGTLRDYIYRNNLGSPSEWTVTSTGGFNTSSINDPFEGAVSIEATNIATGNTLTITADSPGNYSSVVNVLIFYIKSKGTWNNNRVLNFQFRNGGISVGLNVQFRNSNSYGFNSSITATYQRVVIPLSAFGLIPSDVIDNLRITASGSGGTFGFYIDDIELQGANILPYGNTSSKFGVTSEDTIANQNRSFDFNGYNFSWLNTVQDNNSTSLLALDSSNRIKTVLKSSLTPTLQQVTTAGAITTTQTTFNGGVRQTNANALNPWVITNNNTIAPVFSTFQIAHGDGDYGLVISRATDNGNGSNFTFFRTRGVGIHSTFGALVDGDIIGTVNYRGIPADNSSVQQSAEITVRSVTTNTGSWYGLGTPPVNRIASVFDIVLTNLAGTRTNNVRIFPNGEFCLLNAPTGIVPNLNGMLFQAYGNAAIQTTLTVGAVANPNVSAVIDVQSTTKGFLPPRMTGAQAEAIVSPAEGLLVYSTDGSGAVITTKGWWGYEGTTWVKLN